MANVPESNLSVHAGGGQAGRMGEDAQLAIADEIKTGSARSRNASAPIAVLFPELLARMFQFLAAEEPPISQRHGRGWIPLTTHICHYWRQIALNHSALWTDISFDLGMKWADTMIARAKAAPLSIRWDLKDVSRSHSVVGTVVRKHLAHTRALDIRGIKALDSFFKRVASLPAPMLETVELHANNCTEEDWSVLRSIPAGFFAGKVSRLRELSLYEVGYSWTSIPTVALRCLAIDAYSLIIPMHSHALDQFIDFLGNTPTLEELTLRHKCLPYNTSSYSTPGDRVVKMPHLRRVDLVGPRLLVVNVLRHIDTAALLHLHLHLTNVRPSHPSSDPGFIVPPHLFPVLDVLVLRDDHSNSPEDFVFPCPAPNLKTFELRRPLRLSEEDAAANPRALAQFVFNSAPKLQRLNLQAVVFSLDTLPIASLTHLHLVLPSNSWSLVTFDGLLDYLEGVPTLQVLSLINFLPPHVVGSTRYKSDRMVSLSHMGKLALHGTACDVAALLQHIRLPETAKLSVEGTELESSSGVVWDSTSTFPFTAPIHTRSPYICSLRISPNWSSGGHELEVHGYRHSLPLGNPPWPQQLKLKRNREYNHDIDILFCVPVPQCPPLHKILSPVIQVEALVVQTPRSRECWDTTMAESDWRDVFRQSQFVQYLEIVIYKSDVEGWEENVIALLRAMTLEASDGQSSLRDGEDVILPNLTSLCITFHGYLFGEDGEQFRAPLLSFLSARKDSGIRMQSLLIQSCETIAERSSSPGFFDETADEVSWNNLPYIVEDFVGWCGFVG